MDSADTDWKAPEQLERTSTDGRQAEPSTNTRSPTSHRPKPTRGKGPRQGRPGETERPFAVPGRLRQASLNRGPETPEPGRNPAKVRYGPYPEPAEVADMSTPHNSPDPEGLATAREIQDRLRPAEVILFGSRAHGSHSPGSDVDLTAIAPDEDIAERTEETVNEILQGRRGAPEVTVATTTREELRQWALLGQSFAGQAARYGVTPDGRSLDYQPEREPTAGDIWELTTWWLKMAEGDCEHMRHMHIRLPKRPAPACLTATAASARSTANWQRRTGTR